MNQQEGVRFYPNDEELINNNQQVGVRFYPNDEELINNFLIRIIQEKNVLGLDSEINVPIAEVEFLKHEPWDLHEFSKIQSNDPFWYFFYQLDYKYRNGRRGADRLTNAGYWSVTGADREVTSIDTNQLIGNKKILVYYEGSASKKSKGQRTNWVIHEYHVTEDFPNPNKYVICCLKKKEKKKTKKEAQKKTNGKAVCRIKKGANKKANGKANTSIPFEGECSHQSPPDFRNQVAENTNLEGEGACPVDHPSQADPQAIKMPFEGGLSYQDLSLSKDFSSYTQSQTDLEMVMYAQQGAFDQHLPLSNSFNSNTLSQADLERVAFSKLLSQLYPQQGASYQNIPLSNAFNGDPAPKVDLAAACQNLPLLDGFSNDCIGVPTQCESYPVEVINWGSVGMAQPLESLSGISYCEDGGMSCDTNNEEAIEQANKHVTAADFSSQLSHNFTQHVITTHLSSQLSHNSTQQIPATHLTPQLSHSSNACMGWSFEDSNKFVWLGLV